MQVINAAWPTIGQFASVPSEQLRPFGSRSIARTGRDMLQTWGRPAPFDRRHGPTMVVSARVGAVTPTPGHRRPKMPRYGYPGAIPPVIQRCQGREMESAAARLHGGVHALAQPGCRPAPVPRLSGHETGTLRFHGGNGGIVRAGRGGIVRAGRFHGGIVRAGRFHGGIVRAGRFHGGIVRAGRFHGGF